MSDYFKLRIAPVYSHNSDYSDPEFAPKIADFESTTVTKYWSTLISAATTGTTLDLVNFTTVECVIVINRDTTNYVDLSYTSAGTSSKSRIIAGGMFALAGTTTPSGDLVLTANTAACLCEVIVVGT